MSLTAASRMRVNLQKDSQAKGESHAPKPKKHTQLTLTNPTLTNQPTAPTLPARRKPAPTQAGRQSTA